MKESDQIPAFVFACLRKDATEHETQQLKNWLKVDGNNSLYRQLQKVNELTSDLQLYRSYDLAAGRRRVQKGIRENKRATLLKWTQRIAAVLFLPMVLTCLFFIFQNRALKSDLNASGVAQQVNSQPGTRTHFFLPDGTEVWLNAASTIRFPSVFSKTSRLVELDGEAYFKVQEDKKKPFIVKNGGFRVEALGTAFNLCAYSEDQKFLATLEEGKIKVSENSVGQSLVAVPGEQIRFLVREKQFDKEEVEVRNVVAWKDGRLIFDQTPFFDVVSTLSRWFNVDIKLVDPSVANYRYTATFTDESLTQVLELLKLTAPIEFTSSARSVTANNSFTKEQIQIRRDSNVQIRIQN